MRTNRSYLNRGRNLALANVDLIDRGAISTWFAHAGISINEDVDETSVRRNGGFMTAYPDRDGREGAAQVRSYQQYFVFRLVDNHQRSFFAGCPSITAAM